jgi:hypothetical protein
MSLSPTLLWSSHQTYQSTEMSPGSFPRWNSRAGAIRLYSKRRSDPTTESTWPEKFDIIAHGLDILTSSSLDTSPTSTMSPTTSSECTEETAVLSGSSHTVSNPSVETIVVSTETGIALSTETLSSTSHETVIESTETGIALSTEPGPESSTSTVVNETAAVATSITVIPSTRTGITLSTGTGVALSTELGPTTTSPSSATATPTPQSQGSATSSSPSSSSALSPSPSAAVEHTGGYSKTTLIAAPTGMTVGLLILFPFLIYTIRRWWRRRRDPAKIQGSISQSNVPPYNAERILAYGLRRHEADVISTDSSDGGLFAHNKL